MTSFLQRLKSKNVVPVTATDERAESVKEQQQVAQKTVAPQSQIADQLRVDIFQTPNAIVVHAQIAGAGIEDYSVLIEGDNDIVVIKGKRNRPNGEYFQNIENEQKEPVLNECSWGDFYRQIILPAEVDAGKAEAKSANGVLMLYLPLQKMASKGVRLNVTTVH